MFGRGNDAPQAEAVECVVDKPLRGFARVALALVRFGDVVVQAHFGDGSGDGFGDWSPNIFWDLLEVHQARRQPAQTDQFAGFAKGHCPVAIGWLKEPGKLLVVGNGPGKSVRELVAQIGAGAGSIQPLNSTERLKVVHHAGADQQPGRLQWRHGGCHGMLLEWGV